MKTQSRVGDRQSCLSRPTRLSVAHLTIALLALCFPAFAQVHNYKEIKTPALRSFTPVQPARVQLSNGMILLLQEEGRLSLDDKVAKFFPDLTQAAATLGP